MTGFSRLPKLLPPRLSMDEYVDFLEAALKDCDRVRAARQKELEERIRTPFRMVDDTAVPAPRVVGESPE